MAFNDSCVETIRSGDKYFLIDAKDYKDSCSSSSPGPVAVLPATEYEDRIKQLGATGNPDVLFDSPAQYESFGEGELRAHVAYAAAGLLSHLGEGQIVTAYENMRDLPKTAQ